MKPSIVIAFLLLLVVFFSLAQSEKTYKLEIVVVVDKFARDRWVDWVGSKENMIQDLKSNIMAANFYYQQSDLDLEIRVKKIVILKGNITRPGEVSNDNLIYTGPALKAIRRYISSSEYRYPYYDAAMYFTGHNMGAEENPRSNPIGVAWMGTACTSSAMSVVELSRDNLDGTIAHELAHILGSDHDSGRCRPEDGYLMSPSGIKESKNRFSFSRCSIDMMKNYIRRLNSPFSFSRDCLVDTEQGPFIYNQPGHYVRTANDVCKKHVGDFSWAATYNYAPGQYDDAVCRYFTCFSRTRGSRYYSQHVFAPSGMICGKGKRCSLGVCAQATRNSTDGSGVTDRCRLGEPKDQLPGGAGRCRELSNFYCRQEFYRNMCCLSCEGSTSRQPNTGSQPNTDVDANDDCRRRLGFLADIFC